jgi:tRNA (guanine37-N1)-methyltransferase
VVSFFLFAVRIDILTLFPKICEGALSESMMKRAQEKGLAQVAVHNIRDWAVGRYLMTDDAPYGGGQGMVMKCEPIFAAVEALRSPGCRVVLMSPAGRRFDQPMAERLALQASHLIVICGHYEGVDQRVIDHLVDEEISIGDYVLTNGAIAALVMTDAVVRLIPGVLGDEASAVDDSFSTGLLEFPHYTRPVEFQGWRVPEVLLSGHHGEIAKWRRERALEKTRAVRPDLLEDKP